MWPTVAVCSRLRDFYELLVPTLGIFRQVETSWSLYPEVSSPPHVTHHLRDVVVLLINVRSLDVHVALLVWGHRAPCPGWLQQ